MAGRNNKSGRSKGGAQSGRTVQASSAGRVANVQRIARARANRGSADQRRTTADSRMYSENKARKGYRQGSRATESQGYGLAKSIALGIS